MEYFTIGSGQNLNKESFKDTEVFLETYPSTLPLYMSQSDLDLLLKLLDINISKTLEIKNGFVDTVYEITSLLPEMNEEEYNNFYNNWIKESKRENTMDEYSQLVFLQGMAKEFNQSNIRFISKEA